ncbi:unnamed protein product [Orchesella dallaii]|uniref:Cytochrome c oxidase assembly protein COX15 n=1 Tax=Orchesella dallaii TaxID=48710 RepID=A0ABP1R2U9_9HEXA
MFSGSCLRRLGGGVSSVLSQYQKVLIPRTAKFVTFTVKKCHSPYARRFITTISERATAVPPAVPKSGRDKLTGLWLLGCGGMCFGAVVLGGVTRLTESGLSMVSWKLFGEKPPLSEDDWKAEFERYQEYPEFKIKNKDITLDDFKSIWRMEYIHRMWGRTIGAVFYIPAGIMWYEGYFCKVMKRRVVILGSLLAFQGLLGWYMVKSGLEDRFHGASDVPRVSQYRLAAHLGSAFVLYSFFLWSALDKLLPVQNFERTKQIQKFRKFAHGAKGLVFITALSGAFVAGLDAGLVYNSFPKMADKWIPDDVLAFKPTWKNFTENPTTVQFDHRILGITTFSTIMGLWALSRKTRLPSRAALATNLLAVAAVAQVTLGITTLLLYVPTHLAATHQSGSLVLLSLAIWLTHELKRLPK